MEIFIRKPEKYKNNGLVQYSAFVKSGYDEPVIQWFSEQPARSYTKATQEWEMPIDLLPDFCNYFEDRDITITGIYHDLVDIFDDIPKEYTFKTKPFEHQREAIKFAMSHKKILLGDDRGLGKTKSIIDTCGCIDTKYGINKVLIVCCVNSTKYNWLSEISIHSDYSGYVLGTRYRKNGNQYEGSLDDKLYDLDNLPPDKFIITNIETLRSGAQRLGRGKYKLPVVEKLKKLCKEGVIDVIAVDEFHRCKDESAIQTKGLMQLQAPYQFAMTGTPIMNKPIDLYTILKWLSYEQSSAVAFRNYYTICSGWGNRQIVGYKHLDRLKQITDKIMLRRLKEDIADLGDFPEKTHAVEYVEMTAKQSKIYSECERGILDNIDKICVSVNPLSQLTRLRQITGYTGIVSTTIKESAKLKRMKEIVDDIIECGKKVIIFSNWASITRAVAEYLKDYKYAYITGEVNNIQRAEEVQKFQTDDEYKVIIGTIGAMGTGLTLTAAQYVIFIDEPQTMAMKQQAEDRAHRIGSKYPVTIIDLICKNTIDERIHDLIIRKGMMSDAIIDNKISIDEIYELLGVVK